MINRSFPLLVHLTLLTLFSVPVSAQCRVSAPSLLQAISKFPGNCGEVYEKSKGHACEFNRQTKQWVCSDSDNSGSINDPLVENEPSSTLITSSQSTSSKEIIVVRAKGRLGNEVFELRINNQTLLRAEVSTNFQLFSASTSSESINSLEVHFPESNHRDQDLQIDYVKVGEQTYQSESPSTESQGSWDSETGCDAGNKQSEWIHCVGGWLRYAVSNLPETPNEENVSTAQDTTSATSAVSPPSSTEINTGSNPDSLTASQPAPDTEAPAENFSGVNQIGPAGTSRIILDRLPISSAQVNTAMTSLAVQDGLVYTANVERGPNGVGGDQKYSQLRTVVRQGRQDSQGNWQWSSTVVDDRTAHDKYHNVPSIAVDNNGYVHVVYNMHNLPWQYKVSSKPHDISSFDFRGQPISEQEFNSYYYENKVTFRSLGSASIPGNQITYPTFSENRRGDLFLSYRFAARPARAFSERMMSAGLASYNVESKTWSSIGASVELSPGFDFSNADNPNAGGESIVYAGQVGWTAYYPRISFDGDDNMYVFSRFRVGTAGAHTSKPCMFRSINQRDFTDIRGNAVNLPVRPANCSNLGVGDNEGLWAITSSMTTSDGEPYAMYSFRSDRGRQLVHYSKLRQEWIWENSPQGAAEVFIDSDDNIYTIDHAPIQVMKKNKSDGSWQSIYSDPNQTRHCFPVPAANEDGSVLYIHAHSCDGESNPTFSIHAIQLR